MVFNQVFQQNRLREQRIQIIRAHLEALDVEPTFPFPIFEKAVLEIETPLSIILSGKVEGSRLLGGRCDIMPLPKGTWPEFLTHTFKFLAEIETRLGVRINCDSFKQFTEVNIGSRKIRDSTFGIHLGSKLEDSSVRIFVHFDAKEDCEELARTAIALDGGHYSDELMQVLLKDMTTVSFELFFDGRSYMDMGAAAPARPGEIGIRGTYLTPYIQKHFSQKVNFIFRGSYVLKICFSKAYTTPLLWFYFKNFNDVKNYFKFNSLGDRIYDFCQSQSCKRVAVVTLIEQELEKSRLENFCFYYNIHDECQPLPEI
ncbi:MAG: microcyclamide biosynthesis protein [Hapalosiphonaceae cyanobacterium JJU2]|nr:MAG: microcyclamide biosynthesis protein [Hapalosiphonaceae cyanobacterium JJU2]